MKGLLGDAYPSVWIAGEVQRLRTAARGQLYFELIEKGRGDRVQAKLDCVVWTDDRPRVEAALREAGVELEEGVVLRCAGRPDFWPGGGRFQFVVADVDPLFSLGALEKRRRETLRALEAAGLLELNKRLPLAAVPLDIGLVTSEGAPPTTISSTRSRTPGSAFGCPWSIRPSRALRPRRKSAAPSSC